MPVRIKGEQRDLNARDCEIWLRKGGLWETLEKLSDRYYDYLESFLDLEVSKVEYGPEQQSELLDDLREMITPGNGPRPNEAHIQAAKETFKNLMNPQESDLKDQLARNNVSNRVNCGYSQIGQEPPKLTMEFFLVNQNKVAVTEKESPILVTQGFAGCTAVLVTPFGAEKGGILAHIAESGNKRIAAEGTTPLEKQDRMKASKASYLVEVVGSLLQLAQQQEKWKMLDITIAVGDMYGTEVEVPDLAEQIRLTFGEKYKIEHIQDLRRFQKLTRRLLYDPADKKLYLSQTELLPTKEVETMTTRLELNSKTGELRFVNAYDGYKMTYYIFE